MSCNNLVDEIYEFISDNNEHADNNEHTDYIKYKIVNYILQNANITKLYPDIIKKLYKKCDIIKNDILDKKDKRSIIIDIDNLIKFYQNTL